MNILQNYSCTSWSLSIDINISFNMSFKQIFSKDFWIIFFNFLSPVNKNFFFSLNTCPIEIEEINNIRKIYDDEIEGSNDSCAYHSICTIQAEC